MDNFSGQIYTWYKSNKRDLPWRNTKDAYKIWLSEIILQQTRVAQGIQYYLRLTEAFPTVEHLAAADEHEVLKLLQGLGYYSRARNLHAAAKEIVNSYHSVFPNTYENIIKLKGIGPYTAAAVASIAFKLYYPTIDGNVYRVLSRYFGIDTPINNNEGKKQFEKLAWELLPKSDPGDHNQALMEFGALQCVPKSPDCLNCPLNDNCYAFQNKMVGQLPVKLKKTQQQKRFFYYYLIEKEDTIFLEKRTANDIWKNLYQFPLMESKHELNDEQLLEKGIPFAKNGECTLLHISSTKKHVLSHRLIYARLIFTRIDANVDIPDTLIQVNKKDIFKFAVPRLIELFLEDYNLVNRKINNR